MIDPVYPASHAELFAADHHRCSWCGSLQSSTTDADTPAPHMRWLAHLRAVHGLGYNFRVDCWADCGGRRQALHSTRTAS